MSIANTKFKEGDTAWTNHPDGNSDPLATVTIIETGKIETIQYPHGVRATIDVVHGGGSYTIAFEVEGVGLVRAKYMGPGYLRPHPPFPFQAAFGHHCSYVFNDGSVLNPGDVFNITGYSESGESYVFVSDKHMGTHTIIPNMIKIITAAKQLCTCEIGVLMTRGCQCGGH